MDLNKELIDLDLLYCSECHEFLNIPVMQLRNRENICGRCYEKNSNRECMENIIAEAVLRKMVVPCRNRLNGCDIELPYETMWSHELSCSFQKYNCVKTDCSTTGVVDDMVRHLEEVHPDLLLLSDDNVFKFTIDLNAQPGEINRKWLKCDEVFNLMWKMDGSVHVKVVYLHEMKEEYSYRVEGYEIFDEEMVVKRLGGKTLEKNREDLQTDWSDSICVDLEKLRALNLEKLKIVLKVGGSKSIDYKINKEALSPLECPICIEYMLPPIYQCMAGHNICKVCHLKFQNCPTCKAWYDKTRNYSLETISSKALYPCPNKDNGCNLILPGNVIENHKYFCKFRKCSCLIINCPWTGKPSDVIEHYKKFHTVNESCKISTKINLQRDSSRSYSGDSKYFNMIAFNHLFRIIYYVKNNTATCYFFILSNYLQLNDNFKYEIMYSNDKKDTTLTKTIISSTEACSKYYATYMKISCEAIYSTKCINMTINIKKNYAREK